MTLDKLLGTMALVGGLSLCGYSCQSTAPSSDSGVQYCSKDADCKGDRVCEKGVCVETGSSNSSSGFPCEIKETTGCEDFTGVYTLDDIKKTRQCNDDIDSPLMSFITYEDCTAALSNADDCLFACHKYTIKGNHLTVQKYGLDFVKCGNTIRMTTGGCDLSMHYTKGRRCIISKLSPFSFLSEE